MKKKIHAVGIIFENEHGQILVLRRNPRDPEGGTLGLVGGKPDGGEDIKAAAVREVQEEIGHKIEPAKLQFLKSYLWERENIELAFDVFKLSALSDEVTLEIDENEHTEHFWKLPKDLYHRKDLTLGLYPILEDVYGLTK